MPNADIGQFVARDPARTFLVPLVQQRLIGSFLSSIFP
jgi:hypothetical protein